MLHNGFIAPKRGREYELEVWTEEYAKFRNWWNSLTSEDRELSLDQEGIEWERTDDERINAMRMSMAYTNHKNITKYKPEYETTEARRRARQGYNPVVVAQSPIKVELPNVLSLDDDDDALESKLRWPEPPMCCNGIDNFDEPSWYNNMRLMVSIGRHIAIEGPPSIGKDTAVEQLAAEFGKPLVTIGGDAGFRTRDLTGGQQIVNGTSFFDVGEYVAAAINGWWVLMTEVNAADPSALMYINRQLAAPYVVNLGGKSFPVHPDFRLFVTYNHGLVGTKPLPQSFKDRFFSIKESFFTETQLRKRLFMMGMSHLPEYEMANAQIVQFGIAMWDAFERGKMRYQITTRRLKDAIDLMVVGNVDVKVALKAAVLGAIDSPIEYKAAESVLNEVMRGY